MDSTTAPTGTVVWPYYEPTITPWVPSPPSDGGSFSNTWGTFTYDSALPGRVADLEDANKKLKARIKKLEKMMAAMLASDEGD